MDRTWMRGLWITLSLLALLLAGCGASSSRAGTSASAPTATTRPIVTPTPASTATSAPTATLAPAADACANLGGYGAPVGTPVRVGDLGISQVSFAYAYPAKQVPDGTALKPLQLPSSPNGAPGPNNPLPDSPPTNPTMTEPGGYRFHVCNVGAQSHVLRSVTVRVNAVAPTGGNSTLGSRWMATTRANSASAASVAAARISPTSTCTPHSPHKGRRGRRLPPCRPRRAAVRGQVGQSSARCR